MGTIAMECIDFLLASQQPCAAPVAYNMGGLAHADCQGDEHGTDSHGKNGECDRTQFELEGRAGPDCNRSGIQLAEVAIEEDSGADKEDREKQSEHRTRPFFSRIPFFVS